MERCRKENQKKKQERGNFKRGKEKRREEKRREEGIGEKDRKIKNDIGNRSRRPNNQPKKEINGRVVWDVGNGRKGKKGKEGEREKKLANGGRPQDEFRRRVPPFFSQFLKFN